MATLKKSRRRSYEQAKEKKAKQIANYIKAHNKGLIQVGAICGLESPHLLSPKDILKPSEFVTIGGH